MERIRKIKEFVLQSNSHKYNSYGVKQIVITL